MWGTIKRGGLAGCGVALLPAQGQLHCISLESKLEESRRDWKQRGCLINLQVKGKGWWGVKQEGTKNRLGESCGCPSPKDRMNAQQAGGTFPGFLLLTLHPTILVLGMGSKSNRGHKAAAEAEDSAPPPQQTQELSSVGQSRAS